MTRDHDANAAAGVEKQASDPLGFWQHSHPLRSVLASEMHLRHLPRFTAPAKILQIVILVDEPGSASSRVHIQSLAPSNDASLPLDTKHAVVPLGLQTLVWERHTEFVTYTVIDENPPEATFDATSFAEARRLIGDLPGQIVRATQIILLSRNDPGPPPEFLSGSFDADALVVCDIAGGKARIWSDFQLHADGLGRLLIADRGLCDGETQRSVQSLQELGNYRNMALLGLPVAQQLAPEVTRLEQDLAELTGRLADPDNTDEPLLDDLTNLSAELARLLAQTRYRMSATRAYAQICADRLAGLQVRSIDGHQTLSEFTDRRLVPAVRTCLSFIERVEELSQRASWTSGLLRTRIDTALARQNRDLLAAMNRRTQLQLRLQQAVEGLSVVAISYYLVALIGYATLLLPLKHDMILAVAAPFCVLISAIALGRTKKSLLE